MMTAVIGTIHESRLGSMIFRPSTAERTEIAGVIMLSPKNSAAPNIPSAARLPPCGGRAGCWIGAAA